MLKSVRVLSGVLAVVLFCHTASYAKPANFAGTWNFALKGMNDTCGLGMKGKTQNLNGVVITQTGSKAQLVIQGVTFNGKVSGKTLKGSGKYNTGGISISGLIKAVLKKKNKISVPSTKLTIKAGGKKCFLVMKGTGSK